MRAPGEILGDHAADEWTSYEWRCAYNAVEAAIGESKEERDSLKDENQKLREALISVLRLAPNATIGRPGKTNGEREIYAAAHAAIGQQPNGKPLK